MSLRPPVLDGIGLVPALERLATGGEMPGLKHVDVQLDGVTDHLLPDTETAIYRVVEDAARVTRGDREASVSYDRSGELTIVVDVSAGGTVGDLAGLRARVELLGGRILSHSTALEARIPLRA